MADTVELDGTDVWLYTSPTAIYTKRSSRGSLSSTEGRGTGEMKP
ncbi:MAG TPA: hypothetical protein PLG38_11145 [Propionibacteriaceae bacterium]|nr:hypothetical protein [Propionibacteriaceae bacterium]HQE32556.1 hypothetical protein [Propionibacteriaceae bacterium]